MTPITFWLWHDRIMYRVLWCFALGGVVISALGYDLQHLGQLAGFSALTLAASAKAKQTG